MKQVEKKGEKMKIFTSYYKRIDVNPCGLIPVRISTGAPQWFSWYLEELPELYPGWDIVKSYKEGTLSKEAYKNKYLDKLAILNRKDILKKLETISAENENRNIVLLCYERPEDFCHRHFVAKWLDADVKELQ